MKKTPPCPYHHKILSYALGRTPYTRMTKHDRRRRAADIARQCLDCQGRPAPHQHLGRDLP